MEKLLVLICLLALACSTPQTKKAKTAKTTQNYPQMLVTGSGTRVRAEAGAGGKELDRLGMGELVGVISKSDQQDTVSGVTAPWYRVQYRRTKVGWVFGKWLVEYQPKKRTDIAKSTLAVWLGRNEVASPECQDALAYLKQEMNQEGSASALNGFQHQIDKKCEKVLVAQTPPAVRPTAEKKFDSTIPKRYAVAAGSFDLKESPGTGYMYYGYYGKMIQHGMRVEILEERKSCFKVPKAVGEDGEPPVDETTGGIFVDEYEGRTLDCYKIKKNGNSGWVINKGLLDFTSGDETKTIEDSSDLSWLFYKYGDSTWYYGTALDEQSFSNREYEKLIESAKNGVEPAQVALKLTLVKALKENPNNPKYAPFKEKVKFLLDAPAPQ